MDSKPMRMRPTVITLLAAGSLLAACHKHNEQAPDNAPAATQNLAPPVQPPAPRPKPTPKPARARVKVAPEPTADQQIIDDADATGMTSHVSRDDDKAAPADNSQQ